MSAIPTYSPILHATATARTQLATTCRYARYAEIYPLQPLKGHQKPYAASVFYRASVPAGHAGGGVALSYRASSPDGESLPFGIEENPSVTSAPTANYSLLTANSSYTFSAKERDSETGLSYFGSRYYSSDLSIWLSVDPQSDKYASLSPYVYCADNPVRLVDPNGEKVVPLAAFQDSKYHKVFQNLSQTNKTYMRLLSKYQDNTHDFFLDYKEILTIKTGDNTMSYRIKGDRIVYTKASSTYYPYNGFEPSEIAMVTTLLHEAVHAYDGLTQRATPNHNGFEQAFVLAGLMEYNSTYNLGYSNEDLEMLSWSGLQKSDEYRNYIEGRAERNKRTFEEEDKYVKSRITILTLGADLDE